LCSLIASTFKWTNAQFEMKRRWLPLWVKPDRNGGSVRCPLSPDRDRAADIPDRPLRAGIGSEQALFN
jgi:hypothetical protein